MSKQPPPAPTASTIGPCPTIIQISRSPRHWKFTQHLRTTRPPPPEFESDWMLNCFNGSLCKWSSIAHYHHPTVLIWRKYCLKGRKIRVIYPPVPFHSKPGPEILFYFILNENRCCDLSLEPFRRADSNEGSQLRF